MSKIIYVKSTLRAVATKELDLSVQHDLETDESDESRRAVAKLLKELAHESDENHDEIKD